MNTTPVLPRCQPEVSVRAPECSLTLPNEIRRTLTFSLTGEISARLATLNNTSGIFGSTNARNCPKFSDGEGACRGSFGVSQLPGFTLRRMSPKPCEFVVDHFACRRCGDDSYAVTRDVDKGKRYVCSRHAAALVARGLVVRPVRSTGGGGSSSP